MKTTPPAALAPRPESALSPSLVEGAERATELAAAARAPRTEVAYAAAWRAFECWAGTNALPADPRLVAAYVGHLATEGLTMASVQQALAAISDRHRAAGYESPRASPLVRDVVRGLARTQGTTPRQAKPLLVAELRAAVRAIELDARGLRDRALLLLGFAAALRESELVALTVGDVTLEPRGVVVHIARSKTDQAGAGADIYVHAARGALCPVAALQAWLEARGDGPGPLFGVSARHVDRILQARLRAAGVNPAGYSGHSLRAGGLTTMARVRTRREDIRAVSRHRPGSAVLERYIRAAEAWEINPLGEAMGGEWGLRC